MECVITERSFKKYCPGLWEDMKKINFPNNFTWIQKLYHFGRNDFELKLGLCPKCGSRCVFNDITSEYEDFCCGCFCVSDIKTKEELCSCIQNNIHKIFHYFKEYVNKHDNFLCKIKELYGNDDISDIISTPRNLFIFLNDNIEHTCKICGKETDFYGFNGKKYIDEIIYFKRACCKECSNKYRSFHYCNLVKITHVIE